MDKYCNNENCCGYMAHGTTSFICKYEGYCDFQRPRDSRMQPLLGSPNFSAEVESSVGRGDEE